MKGQLSSDVGHSRPAKVEPLFLISTLSIYFRTYHKRGEFLRVSNVVYKNGK